METTDARSCTFSHACYFFLRACLFVAGRSDAGKKKNTENVGGLILNVN
jgi:hypothetical protein